MTLGSAARAETTAKDLSLLFAPSRMTPMSLSPDGRRIAYVDLVGANVTVVMRTLGEGGSRSDVYSAPRDGYRIPPVEFFAWSPNNQLVFALAARGGVDAVYVVDPGAAAARVLVRAAALVSDFEPGIHPRSLVVEDAKIRRMNNPFGQSAAPDGARSIHVIGFNAADPAGLLVAAERKLSPRSIYVEEATTYRVDLSTAAVRELENASAQGQYLYDDQGRARLLVTPHEVIHSHGTPPVSTGATRELDMSTGENRRSALAQETSPLLTPVTRFEARQEFRLRTDRGKWENLDALTRAAEPLKFSLEAADFYRPRSFPIAFGPRGTVLYYASNVGSDQLAVYELDIGTGSRKPVMADAAEVDLVQPDETFSARVLVRDRRNGVVGLRVPGLHPTTRWLDARLTELQQHVEARFPERSVSIESWSDDYSRVLLRVYGPTEPGRWFVHEPGPPWRWIEVAREVPMLKTDRLVAPVPFEFTTREGIHLIGRFTPAVSPRVNPAPLVVRCCDIPGPGIIETRYDAEVQAIAALGYAVLEVFHRGAAGLGVTHRDAALRDLDRLPVDDIRAAVAWARGRHAFDARRVALVGHGFGGCVALRALEQHPDEFRCAVMINAPVDLANWLVNPSPAGVMTIPQEVRRRQGFFAGAKAGTAKVADIPKQRPVLIAQDGLPPIQSDDTVSRARGRFRDQGRDFMVLRSRDSGPGAKSRFYFEIGRFLNASVFDYTVRVGEERVVE